MTVTLIDHDRGKEKEFDNRAVAEEKKQEMIDLGVDKSDLEISMDASTDGGEATTRSVEDMPDQAEPVEPEPVEAEVVNPESLSEDPIGFLESVNTDFVNTIKGKPAISKQGFRFIQREFEITTESEVVQWSDDPLGVVVWAKAELNNGYSAEAHGEGYQFESDVSDNEFVRYADTRAKNRAISDLTSAGALAVSELQGE
jgi:hypothetical protein